MSSRVLTVMFTDIKGFTERTAKSSRAELDDILKEHEDLLMPLIPEFEGKLIKTVGDALMIVFDSTTNAVLCGIMMQERLHERNKDLPEDERLEVRVAINTGEMLEREGDVFGEAVNIAARIEGITEASEIYFTESVYLAMNKAEVMEGLYTPLFGDSLPSEGLGNTYWMSNQSTYENHAGDAGYGAGDVESARAALEGAGYVDNGGVYEHPDDGPLSLRVGTTGGNRLREIQQELIQAQMSDAGIEIVIDNVEGAAYFGEVPFSADSIECSNSNGESGNCDVWDITQFAWVGGPWPGGQSASYLGGSGNNPYGYNNDAFDAKSDECDATVDDAERAACYNEMDKSVTTLELDAETGLFMLPITQKPSFYGVTSDLSQAPVAPDANDAGPLVNVVDAVFAS